MAGAELATALRSAPPGAINSQLPLGSRFGETVAGDGRSRPAQQWRVPKTSRATTSPSTA
jgi:hypothetical protein